MLPVGPHSSTETTIKPTIHRTKEMKEPSMTMLGRRRRCDMSQSMMRIRWIPMVPTVTQYVKYLGRVLVGCTGWVFSVGGEMKIGIVENE